jgi:hypothetical protein
MKRKQPHPVPPDVNAPETIAPEIIESAIGSAEPDRLKTSAHCVVCGADANPNPVEQLCWVCRRLKMSAWRDVEQQMPVQE